MNLLGHYHTPLLMQPPPRSKWRALTVLGRHTLWLLSVLQLSSVTPTLISKSKEICFIHFFNSKTNLGLLLFSEYCIWRIHPVLCVCNDKRCIFSCCRVVPCACSHISQSIHPIQLFQAVLPSSLYVSVWVSTCMQFYQVIKNAWVQLSRHCQNLSVQQCQLCSHYQYNVIQFSFFHILTSL